MQPQNNRYDQKVLFVIENDIAKLKERYFEKYQPREKEWSHVPIVMEPDKRLKQKYKELPGFILLLVSEKMPIKVIYSKFLEVLRKKIKLERHDQCSIYISSKKRKNTTLNFSEVSIGQKYAEWKSEDNFVQLIYLLCCPGEFYIDPTFLLLIIPVIVLVGVPYLAGSLIYDWTANQTAKIMTSFGYKSAFKEKHSLEERRKMATKLLEEDKQKIPIILQKKKQSGLSQLSNSKFLVDGQKDFQFISSQLGQKISKGSEQSKVSIFFYINRRIPQRSAKMKQLYLKHRDEDGFLYIVYHDQETF